VRAYVSEFYRLWGTLPKTNTNTPEVNNEHKKGVEIVYIVEWLGVTLQGFAAVGIHSLWGRLRVRINKR